MAAFGMPAGPAPVLAGRPRSSTIVAAITPSDGCDTGLMTDIPDIKIDSLIERYSVLLLDSYGVLAGSTGTFPGAVELVDHLNELEKPYFILTNDASARKLAKALYPETLFDGNSTPMTPTESY